MFKCDVDDQRRSMGESLARSSRLQAGLPFQAYYGAEYSESTRERYPNMHERSLGSSSVRRLVLGSDTIAHTGTDSSGY